MALLLLVASGTAHADLIEIAWDASGSYEKRMTVKSTAFVELCAPLRTGSKVQWDFSGSGLTDFDIHYHRGKTVVAPARAKATLRSNGTLNVRSNEHYCWTWINRSAAAIEVLVQLQKLH